MTANKDDATESVLNPMTLQSPEVLSDGRVVFRIYAPEADLVTIEGDWNTQMRGPGDELRQTADGVWTIMAELPPDFYTYTFTVDGVRTVDPSNTWIKPGAMRIQNMLFVPGEAIYFAATQSVPHGEIRIRWYESSALGEPRRMHVYTPPDYDQSQASHPVLYLLHGGGDDDAAWSTIGRAGFILDNLIAAGKVEPMIVVMPNGKVDKPGFTLFLSDEDKQNPEAMQERIDTISELHDRFVDDLLTSIMPIVECAYRVRNDRESRAIAGLSMGGAETLRVAPSHLDLFAYIGVFSMGLQTGHDAGVNTDFVQRNSEFFADAAKTNDLVKLLYVACGDNDAVVTDGPRLLHETLERYRIEHIFNESSGGHTWINWRRYLYDFAQKLYQ